MDDGLTVRLQRGLQLIEEVTGTGTERVAQRLGMLLRIGMEVQGDSSSSGYGLVLLGLALVLGGLTIRAKFQQRLEERSAGAGEIEVTTDFTSFQGMFMSKHTLCPVGIACDMC